MAAGASSLGPVVLIVRKQRAEGSRAGPQNLKALPQWLAFSIGSTSIPFRNSANWGPRVQTHGAVATTSHPSHYSWYCCLPTIANATYPRDQVAGHVPGLYHIETEPWLCPHTRNSNTFAMSVRTIPPIVGTQYMLMHIWWTTSASNHHVGTLWRELFATGQQSFLNLEDPFRFPIFIAVLVTYDY